ncbi:MAG TPA: PaaI family thioesterase [Xanthobacteraceae bacterium]|nr:PaaI family thioesterase [Xanthobacteraceae bacterium]
MQEAALTEKELERRLSVEFPEAFHPSSGIAILKVWHGGCLVRQDFQATALRPGGTISGPHMMALADIAMYIALLASIGWVPLAVTANLNINFLKKPQPGALDAECRLLKLGRSLAVGDVSIRSGAGQDLVAHATSTYSIPPRSRG